LTGGPAPIPRDARLADDADWQLPPSDYQRIGRPLKRFSWLSPLTLWQSRNNVLASLTGDPTENARRAWVAAQRLALRDRGEPESVTADFTIDRSDLDDFSCMVIGDTGEGDVSQYAVVPAFLSASRETEFTLIASDVLYPAGDVNEYVAKFFVPYASYPRPIYAIPGNHDWLDGLAGFMKHFCAADPPNEVFRPPARAKWSRLTLALHRLFWRRPTTLDESTLAEAERLRGDAAATGPAQPNMYFAIDTPQLRIIGIDTGILGRLDFDQGQWLRRVSAGSKPKLLVSGKPVFAGPKMSPRRILSEDSNEEHDALLWTLLRDPANNYVAMIAGDVHHYERHQVRLPDGRSMQCVISGGGGAFMTSTHQIGRVDRADVGEEQFVLYPTRADSLRAYSMILLRRLRVLTPWRAGKPLRGIPADEAAAIVSARHGLDLGSELARGGAFNDGTIRVSLRSRILSAIVYPRPAWFEGSRISEALDWDEPPFFKNFVRADVAAGVLTLTAFGVTGLARDQDDPAVIDRVEIPLGDADVRSAELADEAS
jgi:hypothetical protein